MQDCIILYVGYEGVVSVLGNTFFFLTFSRKVKAKEEPIIKHNGK